MEVWMKECLRGLKDSLFLLRVCQAMYRLNRWAKESEHRNTIYQFKGLLVRWLCQHGHCESARRQDQVLECWHTPDYNAGWADVCEKCNNTGIFRRIEMFQFVFHVEQWFGLYIASQKFVWHQPANLVDWPVQETGEPLISWEGTTRQSGRSVNPADLWAVRWFLILHRLLPIGALRRSK